MKPLIFILFVLCVATVSMPPERFDLENLNEEQRRCMEQPGYYGDNFYAYCWDKYK